MTWLKISNTNGGTFAREAENDPIEVVTINELQERKAWIEAKVKLMPDQETLDYWNSTHGDSSLIGELQNINNQITAMLASGNGN